MAETIEGGIYKDATGDGYHDANGKPVDASKVSEANKVKQPATPIVVPPVLQQPVTNIINNPPAEPKK